MVFTSGTKELWEISHSSGQVCHLKMAFCSQSEPGREGGGGLSISKMG